MACSYKHRYFLSHIMISKVICLDIYLFSLIALASPLVQSSLEIARADVISWVPISDRSLLSFLLSFILLEISQLFHCEIFLWTCLFSLSGTSIMEWGQDVCYWPITLGFFVLIFYFFVFHFWLFLLNSLQVYILLKTHDIIFFSLGVSSDFLK